MCDPVIGLGIATAVVGGIQTIASYQEANAAASFADNQAYNQVLAQNDAAMQQAAFEQQKAFYNMEQQNAQITISNQRSINDWILSSQQTNVANAQTQREFLMAKQQQDYTNMNNQLTFQAQLNQSILSEIRAKNQQEFNQKSLNAKLEGAQTKRNEAKAQRAFEAERLMASVVQAQGSILASGKSGQSIGLAVLNEGAKYGRDMRMARRNLDSAMGDFYSRTTNAYLDKAQADAEAIASIIPRPYKPLAMPDIPAPNLRGFAPKPVFGQYMTNPGPISKPTFAPMYTAAPRPSTLGLVAGLGGNVLSGVTAGYGMNSMIKKPPTGGGGGLKLDTIAGYMS